jgi:tRNA(fMet)-specific endonuclease VapC
MIGNSILIDTNIVIELFRGNLEVRKTLNTCELVYIPFAVLGELYLGAYKSTNSSKHLTQISQFVKNCSILNADQETAKEYGQLKSILIKKGKPIPENDLWIAAISKQYNLRLATFDKDFLELPEIEIIKFWH